MLRRRNSFIKTHFCISMKSTALKEYILGFYVSFLEFGEKIRTTQVVSLPYKKPCIYIIIVDFYSHNKHLEFQIEPYGGLTLVHGPQFGQPSTRLCDTHRLSMVTFF